MVAAGPRSTLGPVRAKPSFPLTSAAVAMVHGGPGAAAAPPGAPALPADDGSSADGAVTLGEDVVVAAAPLLDAVELESQAPSSSPAAANSVSAAAERRGAGMEPV